MSFSGELEQERADPRGALLQVGLAVVVVVVLGGTYAILRTSLLDDGGAFRLLIGAFTLLATAGLVTLSVLETRRRTTIWRQDVQVQVTARALSVDGVVVARPNDVDWCGRSSTEGAERVILRLRPALGVFSRALVFVAPTPEVASAFLRSVEGEWPPRLRVTYNSAFRGWHLLVPLVSFIWFALLLINHDVMNVVAPILREVGVWVLLPALGIVAASSLVAYTRLARTTITVGPVSVSIDTAFSKRVLRFREIVALAVEGDTLRFETLSRDTIVVRPMRFTTTRGTVDEIVAELERDMLFERINTARGAPLASDAPALH